MKRNVLAVMMLFAVPAYGQGAASSASTGVGNARALWQTFSGYMVTAAEQMPEGDYSYKPVATVRSFGEIMGHVAGAEYMACAAALGESPRAEDDIEKTVTSKAGLVAALKSAAEYCQRAYQQSDAAAAGMTKLFGRDVPRMYALMQNATHVGEHYGNIVTYLRMQGKVPPSSQPRQGSM